jgi:steroid delta-isomerase-like uncharacterized protein
MSRTEENKQLMQRVYEDCFNAGKLEELDRLVDGSFQGVQGQRGPAAFAAPVRALRQAFPDIHYVVEDILAEGDRVAVRWKWTGTHEATFNVYPATHKRISNEGMAIFRIKDGKIAASSIQTDRLGFLQEIGVVSKELGAPPRPR